MSAAEKALAALEAAGKAATERPWTAHGRYIGTRFHKSYVGECRDENGNWSDTAKSRGDSALIVAAVNLSSPLAAVARAAMAVRKAEDASDRLTAVYAASLSGYAACQEAARDVHAARKQMRAAIDALEAAAEGVL